VIRVGVVDSGIDGATRARVVAARDFPAHAPPRDPPPGEPRDRSGHGTRIAEILATVEGIELLDARVMFTGLSSSAAQVAAAIDWLCARGAQVVNLSVGLRQDRALLREACARAVERGVLLVASAPARGAPVYPAAYPGVLRATGDARCAPAEISWLGSTQADAGGHVRTADGALAGASIGCAHVCAHIVRWLCAHPAAARDDIIAALRVSASVHGPERRGAPG
jgi:hypothetical protein